MTIVAPSKTTLKFVATGLVQSACALGLLPGGPAAGCALGVTAVAILASDCVRRRI
ncbi:hypothetical protein ACIBAC_00725 [Streptomyces sp. NPDC051362]|uniref:hypothetical protein n=1 Tax=Streptomyces sp. NPDC051362 TaxID=3365651 RepID=UPI0037A347F3